MQEEFRVIKEFENYSVSNFGRVRNEMTGRILIPGKDSNGYYKVDLRKDNKPYTKHIHRLVGEAFIPNPNTKKCIDHIDNNRLNNNTINLRWVSNQENCYNRSISVNNTSNCKGVYFHKHSKKWRAQIGYNGKMIHIGSFDNKDDAINARYKKAKELFGVYINSSEKPVININIENVPRNAEVNINIKYEPTIEELEKEFEELLK